MKSFEGSIWEVRMVLLSPGISPRFFAEWKTWIRDATTSVMVDLYSFHLKFDDFLIKMDTFQTNFDTLQSKLDSIEIKFNILQVKVNVFQIQLLYILS